MFCIEQALFSGFLYVVLVIRVYFVTNRDEICDRNTSHFVTNNDYICDKTDSVLTND